MRAIILGAVNDLVDSFLYYDRQDDEDLSLIHISEPTRPY